MSIYLLRTRHTDSQMDLFYDYVELSNINEEIATSYRDLLEYFKHENTTPSLCAWNEKVCELATIFVDSYSAYVVDIEENQALTSNQKTMFELGFVRDKGKVSFPLFTTCSCIHTAPSKTC